MGASELGAEFGDFGISMISIWIFLTNGKPWNFSEHPFFLKDILQKGGDRKHAPQILGCEVFKSHDLLYILVAF